MAEQDLIPGELLDESTSVTLAELCRLCGLAADELLAMMEEGILEPRAPAPPLHFAPEQLRRVLTVVRLQRDLGVNLAGAALVVELLEETRTLRRRVRVLERLLE